MRSAVTTGEDFAHRHRRLPHDVLVRRDLAWESRVVGDARTVRSAEARPVAGGTRERDSEREERRVGESHRSNRIAGDRILLSAAWLQMRYTMKDLAYLP